MNSSGTRLGDLEQHQAGTLVTTAEMRDVVAVLVTPDVVRLASEGARRRISPERALDQLVPHVLRILQKIPAIRTDLFPVDLPKALINVSFTFQNQYRIHAMHGTSFAASTNPMRSERGLPGGNMRRNVFDRQLAS